MVRVFVAGVPQPQGSARAFVRGRRAIVTTANPQLHGWRELVTHGVHAALPAEWRLLEGPVTVTLVFALPKPPSVPKRRTVPTTRPDVDKLARAVLDALTGLVFHDDAQVVLLTAMKTYAADVPCGVTVIVGGLHDGHGAESGLR